MLLHGHGLLFGYAPLSDLASATSCSLLTVRCDSATSCANSSGDVGVFDPPFNAVDTRFITTRSIAEVCITFATSFPWMLKRAGTRCATLRQSGGDSIPGSFLSSSVIASEMASIWSALRSSMSSGPFAAAIADAAPSVFIFRASLAKSPMEKFSGMSNWPIALPAAQDLKASNMPSVRDLIVVNRRGAEPAMLSGRTQTSVGGRDSPPSAVAPHLDTVAPIDARGRARARKRALPEHRRTSIDIGAPQPWSFRRFDVDSARHRFGAMQSGFSTTVRRGSAERVVPIDLPKHRAPDRQQHLRIAMSAAVNPGLKDTPVDMDKLLKAVGCPICGEMFTHPVTVVRPRARDREFPRCPNSFFPSRTFRRLTSPPHFVSRDDRWSACTRFATSASSSPCSPAGERTTCAPRAASSWGTIRSWRRKS